MKNQEVRKREFEDREDNKRKKRFEESETGDAVQFGGSSSSASGMNKKRREDEAKEKVRGWASEALEIAWRTVLPGSRFWSEWKSYPLSITEWNHRPLGIQVLALAYRSGEPWNETGYANPEFDALVAEALAIPDDVARSEIMAKLERILREDAVIVQPFWRSLYRHVRPGVTGAEMHPASEIHLYAIGLRDG